MALPLRLQRPPPIPHRTYTAPSTPPHAAPIFGGSIEHMNDPVHASNAGKASIDITSERYKMYANHGPHGEYHGHLKTMHLVDQYRAPSPSLSLKREGMTVEGEERMGGLNVVDQRLKRHIRILRLVSRILAFVVSILVFVPITMTLIKFLRTNTIERVVTIQPPPGTLQPAQTLERTAWARNTTTWPTYMYFGTAAVSLLLNLFIMVSYLRTDVRLANKGAYVATTFSWIVMVGNAVVWGVAAGLYRQQKKNDDLWGWTCSDTAQSIQRVFENEVNFKQYCNVQSFSWYAGIVQALLAVLTIIVLGLVVRRKKTKKAIGREADEQVLLEPKH